MDNKLIPYAILIMLMLLIIIFVPVALHYQESDIHFEEKMPEITLMDIPHSVLIYDDIHIKVNVTDDVGVKEVHLWYKSPEGSENTLMMHKENESTYTVNIPPQNFIGKMFYYIYAEDTEKNRNETQIYEIKIEPRINLTEAAQMLYSQIIKPLRGENETDIYVYSEFPKNESSLPKAKILQKNEEISDSTGVLYNANLPVWFFYIPNLFISNSSNASEACIFVKQNSEIDVRSCVSPIKINNITIFETVFDGRIPITMFHLPKVALYSANNSLENATASAIKYIRAYYGNNTEKVLIAYKNPVVYSVANKSEAWWILYMPTVGEGFSQGLIYSFNCDTGESAYFYSTSLTLPYGSEDRVYVSVSLKNPSWNDSAVIFYSIPEVEIQ